jgi:hypothetical protein
VSVDWRSSHETKVAMFRAALAAQCAGEPYMTANRIVASLLRTDSVRDLCSRAQIDIARVSEVVESSLTLSSEECERIVMRDLAEKGLEFASKEHQASVQLRPLEPRMREMLDDILERHGQLAIPPLELLLLVIRADTALAESLAAHGLTAELIGTAIEGR